MTREPRRLRRTATAAVAAAVLVAPTACTGDPAAQPQSAGTGTPSSAPTESSASPAPAESPSDPTGAPAPGSLATPATRAGPLSRKDFPRPRALGVGWAYSVDAGDAEEGYVGNGTPALARDPEEVRQLAVPFGCPRPRAMLPPDHALEVDYAADGTKVIAIRGEFKDSGAAELFFGARTANLRRCLGRSGGEAVGDLVGTVRRLGDGVLLSDRTPGSDPWAELAVLDRDQVVLVAAQGRLGAPPMTHRRARRLAEEFRR